MAETAGIDSRETQIDPGIEYYFDENGNLRYFESIPERPPDEPPYGPVPLPTRTDAERGIYPPPKPWTPRPLTPLEVESDAQNQKVVEYYRARAKEATDALINPPPKPGPSQMEVYYRKRAQEAADALNAPSLTDSEKVARALDMRTTGGAPIQSERPPRRTREEAEGVLLTNLPEKQGERNSLYADEAKGELISYGKEGQEDSDRGIIPIKKPPGPPPTPDQMSEYNFVRTKMKEAEPVIEEGVNNTVAKWESMQSYSTRSLKPEEHEKKKAEVAQKERDALERGAEAHFTSEYKATAEKAKLTANPPQATEWGLRERAARGDLVAAKALSQNLGEEKAKDAIKRELSNRDLVLPAVKALPKAKSEATESYIRVNKYKELLGMAERGEGGGLVNGIKAWLAPVAEALDMDAATIEKLSDAQVFKLMARAAVGSQRLMLVGSGQVSNYEQQLMQKLSGGSATVSRQAAMDLFRFYINESQGIVDAYNNQIDVISEHYPDAKKLYKHIGKGGGAEKEKPAAEKMTALPPASEHKGRTVKRSDGTRLQSNGKTWNIVR